MAWKVNQEFIQLEMAVRLAGWLYSNEHSHRLRIDVTHLPPHI
jgi:hypothetical protein